MENNWNEVKGDLIAMAKEGLFDVISHGCNCFNTMGAGIAPQFAKAFGADKFPKEKPRFRGDINKLGTIDWKMDFRSPMVVVNSYTQYTTGGRHPLDYEALTLCMRKINAKFEGQRIGLPLIGCGLAGGDWDVVKQIMQEELEDCEVTIVHYQPK